MASRARETTELRKITLPLATGAVGYCGDQVGVIPGTHTGGPISGATNELAMGAAVEDYSQTNGDAVVEVRLNSPVHLEWFAQTGTTITLASHFLTKVYFADGATVALAKTASAINLALAGTVWDVDSVRGVGVKTSSASEVQQLLS